MVKIVITLILSLCPTLLTFSQSEKSQKYLIGQGYKSLNSHTQSPAFNSRFNTYESNLKRDISRSSSGSQNQNGQVFISPMWGGWNRWGAPFNYWYYNDIFLAGRWGYQSPARIHYHQDKPSDTVKNMKQKIRLGVSVGTWNQAGGWMTIGRETYFKMQVLGKVGLDPSRFYSNPDVNFSNASIIWKDQRLSDIHKGWVLYLGIGREFRNLGINASVGLGKTERNFQFFDEYYELSQNGKYSFQNYNDKFISISLGLTHDFQFLSISADYDPIRNMLMLGTGFNF